MLLRMSNRLVGARSFALSLLRKENESRMHPSAPRYGGVNSWSQQYSQGEHVRWFHDVVSQSGIVDLGFYVIYQAG
jgi:hypothetical protein